MTVERGLQLQHDQRNRQLAQLRQHAMRPARSARADQMDMKSIASRALNGLTSANTEFSSRTRIADEIEVRLRQQNVSSYEG
jgi:hypothetical protein